LRDFALLQLYYYYSSTTAVLPRTLR